MENLGQVRDLINKDFDTEEEGLIIQGDQVEMNFLRDRLSLVIDHLLQHNFEKLCNAMYRLDVSERKFQEVLSTAVPADIPSLLADLVIEREMQKVVTRNLYKNKQL